MAPQYGEVRVDYITYTTGVGINEGNATAYVSGLVNNPTFSGNVLIEGDTTIGGNTTISGNLNVSGNINASGVTVSGITGLFLDGTEAAPSIAFASEPNTGIYKSAANTIGITVTGLEALRIGADGDVGIGTAPTRRLSVTSSASRVAQFISTTATANIELTDPDTTSGTIALGRQGNDLSLYTADSKRLSIDVNGFVGINTSAPSAMLHVITPDEWQPTVDAKTTANLLLRRAGTNALNAYGGAITFTKLGGNNAASAIADVQTASNANQHGLSFFTHPSEDANNVLEEKIRLTHDGYFGIGTTTPGYPLQVVGNIRLGANDGGGDRQKWLFEQTDDGSNAKLGIQSFAGGSWNDKLSILSNGKIGINTVDPGNDLSVDGSIGVDSLFMPYGTTARTFTDASPLFQIETNSAGASLSITRTATGVNGPYLVLAKIKGSAATVDSDRLGTIQFQGFDGTTMQTGASIRSQTRGTVATNSVPADLSFSTTKEGTTSPAVRLNITNNGEVLVGGTTTARIYNTGGITASSTPLFQVEQDNSSASIGITRGISNNTGPNLFFYKSRSNAAATPVVSGDRLGIIRFNGADGTNPMLAAEIRIEVDGTVATNSVPGKIFFGTAPAGAANVTDRMAIDAQGFVGIGITSPWNTLSVRGYKGNATSGAQAEYAATFRDSSGRINIGQVNSLGAIQAATTSTNTNNLLLNPFGGNVGIGSDDPLSKLTINNGTASSGAILITDSVAANTLTQPSIKFSGIDGDHTRIRSIRKANAGIADAALYFETGGDLAANNAKMVILGNGNVGIGKTDPGAELDVNGTIKATGIQFPASTNNLPTLSPVVESNLLDDYEEGTFTPEINTNTSADVVYTTTACGGVYIKIGNVVHVQIRIKTTSGTLNASSVNFIVNLPFTSASYDSSTSCFAIGRNSMLTGFNDVGARVGRNNKSITFYDGNTLITTTSAGISLTETIIEVAGTYAIN